MKNLKLKFFLIVILFLVTNLSMFAQKYVYVSVEKAEIKSDTGFFAEKIATTKYGTKLIIIENTIKDKWIKVANENNFVETGWILSANVTPKKVINYFSNNGTTEKEIALAGKGFSESKISSKRKNFDAVNTIEQLSKDANKNENLKKFITEGKLKVE